MADKMRDATALVVRRMFACMLVFDHFLVSRKFVSAYRSHYCPKAFFFAIRTHLLFASSPCRKMVRKSAFKTFRSERAEATAQPTAGSMEVGPAPPEREEEQQAKKLRLTEAAEKAWQDQAAAKAARSTAAPPVAAPAPVTKAAATPIAAPPAATPNPTTTPTTPDTCSCQGEARDQTGDSRRRDETGATFATKEETTAASGGQKIE